MTKNRVTILAALAALAISGVLAKAQQSSSDPNGDYIDRGPGTQILCPAGFDCEEWKSMHVCPNRFAVGGLTPGAKNDLLCRFVGPYTETYFASRTSNNVQRQDMLSCKPGYFVTGVYLKNVYLRCSRVASEATDETLVQVGGDNVMGECGGSNARQAGVVIGVRDDRNQIGCATVERSN